MIRLLWRFWDIRMNAIPNHDTIRAMTIAATPAGMVEAQNDLAEIYEEQRALCVKIQVEQNIASGAFRSLKLISEDDRRAAQARLDGHNAEARRLERSVIMVRNKLQSFRDENAIAVCNALVPLRKAAAERVVRSIGELLAAIEAINKISVSLKESGSRCGGTSGAAAHRHVHDRKIDYRGEGAARGETLMRVVRLEKTFKVRPVVKILPEIEDAFRIRNLRREVARDHDPGKIGHFIPTGERVRHLARLELDYERKYGRAVDTRKLG